MKNLIIATAIAAIGVSCNDQKTKEADVPAEVKTKFESMYPSAKVEKWEEEDGKYEAEFKKDNIINSVVFEANGTYVQSESEIEISALPAGVNEYVTANLSGKKIEEATKITHDDGTIAYETEIGDNDYLFDAKGGFISKEQEEKETEDDDK